MTVLMERPQDVDDDDQFRAWAEALDSFETPPGYSKAEIIEGAIVLSPAPTYAHETFFMKLNRQFVKQDWDVAANLGIRTPRGLFIPDVSVVLTEEYDDDSTECWQRTHGIALVAEITSNNAQNDRGPKRRGYAMAKIPLYLLVDRQRKESVLFSDPADDDYRGTQRRAFGDPIPLPEPFGFTLTEIE